MAEFFREIWNMVVEEALIFAVCVLIAAVLTAILFVAGSNRMKTGVKTLIILCSSELLAAFIGWLGLTAYRNGDLFGGILAGILAAAIAIGFLIGGIYGHKKRWGRE